MNLTCPSCGAEAAAEAWQNDAEARAAFATLAGLPAEVQREAIRYLALFRPARSRLSWARAGRILAELHALTTAGVVKHDRQERPCSPAVWGAAMAQMMARRESIKRPLGNHNYLAAVAFELAGQGGTERESALPAPVRQVSGAPSKMAQTLTTLAEFVRDG
ncbi:hypothetical protein SIID45300_01762 [Candidatus Magnetaquicoccaceae bacterium FCR-1]|uniref:DUF2752 domain-containing protein n=1 Tax=Candidatus Magnetaquiglobus chichijimensis TaxID=3141448 RepID=A0ABQ0C969_9PROT